MTVTDTLSSTAGSLKEKNVFPFFSRATKRRRDEKFNKKSFFTSFHSVFGLFLLSTTIEALSKAFY
jgi:hypothetical protein